MDNQEMESIEIFNAVVLGEPKWYKPWVTVFFLDSQQYLATAIFQKRDFYVLYRKYIEKDDVPYIGIVAHIGKKHIADFMECMAELQRNMAICGYSDYEQFCRHVIGEAFGDDE